MGRLLPGIISNPSTEDEYVPECDGKNGCYESPEICGEECVCDDDLNVCYAPRCHINQTCHDGGVCDSECECIEPDMFCNTGSDLFTAFSHRVRHRVTRGSRGVVRLDEGYPYLASPHPHAATCRVVGSAVRVPIRH